MNDKSLPKKALKITEIPPDYHFVKELSNSPELGRVSYLLKHRQTSQLAVIKQYIFANLEGGWAGFSAYYDLLYILKDLKHPGILTYLDAWEIPQGLILMREYKSDGRILTDLPTLEPENLDLLTHNILKNLEYLQLQIPVIIHLNLKPNNILVDEELNAYFVDFGIPGIEGNGFVRNDLGGTPGFMPREQIRNSELTEATDLYALGVSLACFLAQTSGENYREVLGVDGHIDLVKNLSPLISFNFINWLEKLTEPYPTQRYLNAATALDELNQVDVYRFPEVRLSAEIVEFKSVNYGDILTQNITLENPIPETLLAGIWQIKSHPHEFFNPKNVHPWISFEPQQFEGNKIHCQITVNTSHLFANKLYEREAILHSNTSQNTHHLTLKVQTTSLEPDRLPKRSFLVVFLGGLLMGWFGGFFVEISPKINHVFLMGMGVIIWLRTILALGVGLFAGVAASFGSIPLLGSSLGLAIFLSRLLGGGIIHFFLGIIEGMISGWVFRYHLGSSLPGTLSGFRTGLDCVGGQMTLLITLVSLLLGISLKTANFFTIVAFLVLSIPLGMLIYSQWKIYDKYQQSKGRLVKP